MKNEYPKPTTPKEYKEAYSNLYGQKIALTQAISNMATWYAEQNGAYPKGTILTLKNGQVAKVIDRNIFEPNGTLTSYICVSQTKSGHFTKTWKYVHCREISSAELPKGKEK